MDGRGRSRADGDVEASPGERASSRREAQRRSVRIQATAPRGVVGSPGVYKCRKSDWHQGLQLTVLKQLPTEGSWFQGNPNPNTHFIIR